MSQLSQSKVLADRIFPVEGFVADAIRIVAATILLALCAHIVIPLPWTPVPITGQTFGILLVGILLGARRGALAVALYLLEGAAGLPVFQPLGIPGYLRFTSATGGYLMSYPFAAWITGFIAEKGAAVAARNSKAVVNFASTAFTSAALIAGEIVIFAGGCAWLAVGMGLGWTKALTLGALPFVPGELIKMALILAAVGGLELFRTKD